MNIVQFFKASQARFMNDAASIRGIVLSFVAAALPGTGSAKADAVADFFKGKAVHIVVAYPPGGGYDVYARALAPFVSRHIPGSPTVIVQNMPGAGSLTATNYIYTVAPKDGTVVGAPSNSIAFAPLQGVAGAKFDPTRFNWVGSPSKETGVLIVWHGSPAQTIQDVMQSEILLASSSANATSSFYARVLNATLGLKMKVITGYPGTVDSFLAMERGEVDGYAAAFWNTLKSLRPAWLQEKKIRLLVQYGAEPHPELSGVPFARTLAKTEDDKILLDVANAPLAFGRPYMLPPDVPAERVAAWRRAFLDTYADPAFIAEAGRQQLDIDPSTGEEMQQIIDHAYAAPKAVIARLRALYDVEASK